MHRYPECQLDNIGTAESNAAESAHHPKDAHDSYAAARTLQSIQPVFSCKDTAQVVLQEYTIWRHIRLHCSHRVGMYHPLMIRNCGLHLQILYRVKTVCNIL